MAPADLRVRPNIWPTASRRLFLLPREGSNERLPPNLYTVGRRCCQNDVKTRKLQVTWRHNTTALVSVSN